jgi:hypothetical protein
MNRTTRHEPVAAPDRHLAAVSRSLGWAQESAERGDYTDALAWISVVEATGSKLPPGYHAKRQAWLGALGTNRAKPEAS